MCEYTDKKYYAKKVYILITMGLVNVDKFSFTFFNNDVCESDYYNMKWLNNGTGDDFNACFI